MAEDNRAVAEGSAPRSLQGGMGLHLRGSRVQPSPLAESGDSSDVGQGGSVFTGSVSQPGVQAAKLFPESQNRETENSKSHYLFSAAC
jgi:hypothetical protein